MMSGLPLRSVAIAGIRRNVGMGAAVWGRLFPEQHASCGKIASVQGSDADRNVLGTIAGPPEDR